MPKLDEYITVGFCTGYGDGDYRVSMKVRNLTKKQFDELKLATLSALRCAEDNWKSEKAQKYEEAKSELLNVCTYAQRKMNHE